MSQQNIQSESLLRAAHLSFQLDDGEFLFKDINLSLNKGLYGLVGRNGAGKSVLASILAGILKPFSGSVEADSIVHTFAQLPSEQLPGQTFSQYLRIDQKLHALQKIASGYCDSHYFDLVGDDWLLEQELNELLTEMGLPADTGLPCSVLSGGQLTRLNLWKLFNDKHRILILDEPSNHLDQKGKQWLIDSIRRFPGLLLLVSHDRQLLRQTDTILELSSLGLTRYGGNYDHYWHQKNVEQQAIQRQLLNAKRSYKNTERQIQRNKEKAQKREAIGKQLRRSGSQPKILLDAMRDKATQSASRQSAIADNRLSNAQEKIGSLNSRLEHYKPQKLAIPAASIRKSRLLHLLEVKQQHGSCKSVTFDLYSGDKLRLSGNNGSGKSLFLKSICGEVAGYKGEISINTACIYLDQHFSLINPERSILENFLDYCPHLKQPEARTLLASVGGFRKEVVNRKVALLSGGERMKLSLLIVCHQQEQPLLLLDEPDNHLDLESKQLLAAALNDYPGSFILVSHDEDFCIESGVQNEIKL
ncbi:ATP-binding cassette domain-containing protein [Endozoicomonas lisbonensis]|uniref:ATPase subunit of ABC transporter with duplicated ATPase domains n=1 Tax=Endozoicomonas lisbonensis TaxID=3120522 RepID=A0ABV2SDE9_9GAMM